MFRKHLCGNRQRGQRKEETAENTAEILEEPEECPEAWKGLLIPENPSLLHVRMSAKAGTKFGVKEFRKDMCKQPLTEKCAVCWNV